MYGINNEETLPQEFLNNYSIWDAYVADIWYNLFFFCGLSKRDKIIEVAPGTSSKIGWALAKSDFQGDLFVIEPSEKELSIIINKYRECLPKATIYPIQKTLANSLSTLPTQPDFIVSNHPLDDMLIAASYSGDDPSSFFDWTLKGNNTPPFQLKSHWLTIESDPDKRNEIQRNVFYDWSLTIQSLKPKNLILSQYASASLNNNGLGSLNIDAGKVLQSLRKHYNPYLKLDENIQTVLNAHKNYGDIHIGKEVLNAKNWMVAAFFNK